MKFAAAPLSEQKKKLHCNGLILFTWLQQQWKLSEWSKNNKASESNDTLRKTSQIGYKKIITKIVQCLFILIKDRKH